MKSNPTLTSYIITDTRSLYALSPSAIADIKFLARENLRSKAVVDIANLDNFFSTSGTVVCACDESRIVGIFADGLFENGRPFMSLLPAYHPPEKILDELGMIAAPNPSPTCVN